MKVVVVVNLQAGKESYRAVDAQQTKEMDVHTVRNALPIWVDDLPFMMPMSMMKAVTFSNAPSVMQSRSHFVKVFFQSNLVSNSSSCCGPSFPINPSCSRSS